MLACLACGKLTMKSRCEQHQLVNTRDKEKQRLNDKLRVREPNRYNYNWQKAAKAAIKAQPWCSFCNSQENLTGDHIIPKSMGGSNDPSNIRVLCKSCNSRRGNKIN